MENKHYKHDAEILTIFIHNNLEKINQKNIFVGFSSIRKLEKWRNTFESKFNNIYKTNCTIDLHFREKI